jgi:hypothetical protein
LPFQKDPAQPSLRILLAENLAQFQRAVDTFGERNVDPKAGRPHAPPRMPKGQTPTITKAGEIPNDPAGMPDEIEYDQSQQRLLIGTGFVARVPPAVWRYEVSGKRVLTQWFSYRKKNRERPIMGDRRPPSKLGDIQPEYWGAEYTTELLNVLNVLALLVAMEPGQAQTLEEICDGATLGFRR